MVSVAALTLVGCSVPKVNYSGLEASVARVEGDDFGKCMAESHRGAIKLDMAKQRLSDLQGGSDSPTDLAVGEEAIAAAAKHKAMAEAGCMAMLDPLEERVGALESGLEALEARVKKLETVREIIRGVTFPTGSSRLTRQAQVVLDVVANRLIRAPRRVEIQGHASAIGNADMNMRLSQARADSVMKFFVARGVDGSMLSARGYGTSQPVADNSTKAGQMANQRIELKFMD